MSPKRKMAAGRKGRGPARRPGRQAAPGDESRPEATPERLQKIMAASGLGSRRGLEERIRQGAVRVNGRKAELGQSVGPGDRITYGHGDWTVTASPVTQRTLLYNKPEGEVTSRADEAGRPTVFDRLPRLKGARWVAIGRLDIATTGLLILTTDGELAHAMMHPSNQVDREYVCRVRGDVSEDEVEALRTGVELEDGPARFNDIDRLGHAGTNPWFQVTLLEGRNREVRRLWESQGHQVSRLKRVRYGAARLPRGLALGRWSELGPKDHRVLRTDVGLSAATHRLTLEPRGGKGSEKRSSPRSRKGGKR
ncbi:pseudouridine synthase [Elongatibacter sediminis]|uniref:Pseudouridine synthase n=1 Tax=Elongatibacter sediminis TaxID=3119006 RepID=A0AAW9RFQ2_9GAMM